MIAAATASNESGRSAAASSGIVSTTSRAFISTPITPVDAGSTSCSWTPSAFAADRTHSSATRSPVRVAQLALPALISQARTRPARDPQISPREFHRRGHHQILREDRCRRRRRVRNDQRQIVLRHLPNPRVRRGVSKSRSGKCHAHAVPRPRSARIRSEKPLPSSSSCPPTEPPAIRSLLPCIPRNSLLPDRVQMPRLELALQPACAFQM